MGYEKSRVYEPCQGLIFVLKLIDVLAADCLWKSHFEALQLCHPLDLGSISYFVEFEFGPFQQRMLDGRFQGL